MQTVISDYIAEHHLRDLEAGNIILRIKNFCDPDIARDLADILLGTPLFGYYRNAQRIGRVGTAFFEAQTSPDVRRDYEANARSWIRQMRAWAAPRLTPIDRLRLEIDEAWPHGSVLASLRGRKMFAGLARSFDAGAGAEPHQDVFSWDAPGEAEAEAVHTQIAANIYLRMPERGGELTIWPVRLDRDEYERDRIAGSYGVHRDRLPAPAACIRPEPGELILFNANHVHAVETGEGGARVTWSCFIGVRRQDGPLIMWS